MLVLENVEKHIIELLLENEEKSLEAEKHFWELLKKQKGGQIITFKKLGQLPES